jgi:hypothetical protein
MNLDHFVEERCGVCGGRGHDDGWDDEWRQERGVIE